MRHPWDERYPDAALLRCEIHAMISAFVEILKARIPAEEITGVYFKGSARRQWESPVDYVPELSDVDIHLLLRDVDCVRARLANMDAAVAILSAVEEAYRARVSAPLHVPRPQLTVVNEMIEDPDYVPSPAEIVETLYGEAYPDHPWPEESRAREIDRAKLLAHAPVLERLPLRVIDKPGPYLWTLLRELSWRISPVGPRVLSILGHPSRDVWLLNRTRTIELLQRSGEPDLAEDYEAYYLSAWDYFLSGYRDPSAGRRTIQKGAETLRRSIEIAQRCSY